MYSFYPSALFVLNHVVYSFILSSHSTNLNTCIHPDSIFHGSVRTMKSKLSYQTANATRQSLFYKLFGSSVQKTLSESTSHFIFDFNELTLCSNNSNPIKPTTAVILIHPIGIGIGKWYYDRLLISLSEKHYDPQRRLVFLAPDLLGSGTATAATCLGNEEKILKRLPLLNVTDWSFQISNLMAEYEAKTKLDGQHIVNWGVVANGGCSPIALKVAEWALEGNVPFNASLTNVILSSPPTLSFFLESSNPIKVRKSYRILSGLLGKIFWWYALRKDGKFIQEFSERNLFGNATNLGDTWTPRCLATARTHRQSRYSTFAFLAGALQDGCVQSLKSLCGSTVYVDFIRGKDTRKNPAKSWFWRTKSSRDRTIDSKEEIEINEDKKETLLKKFIQNNGNRGKELFVSGRICLAWEDSDGYALRLMELISK